MLRLSELTHGQVADIGGSKMWSRVRHDTQEAMRVLAGSREVPIIPDEPLYDSQGMTIWNEIIQAEGYYQFDEEMGLLRTHGQKIVSLVDPGVSIIDLGAGDTRKSDVVLRLFEKARKPASYYALDISKNSLDENLAKLKQTHPSSDPYVKCVGLWGTFDDGQEFVRKIPGQRVFFSFGSVLCNDPFLKALDHLKTWADIMRPDDLLLIGMDGHLAPKHAEKIWASYHAREDLYRKFFMNGFNRVNKLLGETALREDDWSLEAQLESEPTTRHRFFFRAKRDSKLEKTELCIPKGRVFDWFDAHKHGEVNVEAMCSKSGLKVMEIWKPDGSEFTQYLVKLKNRKDPKEDADSGVSGLS